MQEGMVSLVFDSVHQIRYYRRVSLPPSQPPTLLVCLYFTSFKTSAGQFIVFLMVYPSFISWTFVGTLLCSVIHFSSQTVVYLFLSFPLSLLLYLFHFIFFPHRPIISDRHWTLYVITVTCGSVPPSVSDKRIFHFHVCDAFQLPPLFLNTLSSKPIQYFYIFFNSYSPPIAVNFRLENLYLPSSVPILYRPNPTHKKVCRI